MSRGDRKKSRENKKPKQAENKKKPQSEYALRQATSGSTSLKIRTK